MSEASGTVEPKDVEFKTDAVVADAGDGSRVYHESAAAELDSKHDGRRRTILVNDRLAPDADGLLVDTVTYGEEVSCPVHYHEDTDHFFYILEGEGIIEIEGEAHDVEAGSVVWVGEGDRHRVYCKPGQEMRILEYFSNDDRETVYTDGPACTWSPGDESE